MSENALFGIILFAVSAILLDFSRKYSSNKKQWSILNKKADRLIFDLLFSMSKSVALLDIDF